MAARSECARFLDPLQQAIGRNIGTPKVEMMSTSVENAQASAPLVVPPELKVAVTADNITSRPLYPVVKPRVDIVIATILLLLILPFVAIVALIIKATSPGAVIFRQIRVGQGMKLFTCYKFRSMVHNAEWHLEQNAELTATHATNWKLKKDPRVTSVGRILRKFSLDELPQLVNVIKGDMSLVGPRPYMPKELEGEFGEHAAIITAVRPGMTGLWQVSGRSSLAPSDRIALDEVYATDVNVKLDLFIMIKTIRVVVHSKGAF